MIHMKTYRIITHRDDLGALRALLVVVELDGSERPMIIYENWAQAETARREIERRERTREAMAIKRRPCIRLN